MRVLSDGLRREPTLELFSRTVEHRVDAEIFRRVQQSQAMCEDGWLAPVEYAAAVAEIAAD